MAMTGDGRHMDPRGERSGAVQPVAGCVLLEWVRAVDLARFGIGKEVIVVDDHSMHATPEIVSRFDDVILKRPPRNGDKAGAVSRTGSRR